MIDVRVGARTRNYRRSGNWRYRGGGTTGSHLVKWTTKRAEEPNKIRTIVSVTNSIWNRYEIVSTPGIQTGAYV